MEMYRNSRGYLAYVSKGVDAHIWPGPMVLFPSSTTTQFCQSTFQYTTMASTQREIAQLMADVTPWYKDPGRRKLYALLLIALLSSATNGYDGYVCCHNSP